MQQKSSTEGLRRHRLAQRGTEGGPPAFMEHGLQGEQPSEANPCSSSASAICTTLSSISRFLLWSRMPWSGFLVPVLS